MKVKSVLFGLLLAIGLIGGAVTKVSASGPNYEPVVEWCWVQPRMFVMACIPWGDQYCQTEVCNDQIR